VNLDLGQLKALFEALRESDISEFEFEDETIRLRIGRGAPGQVVVHEAAARAPITVAPGGSMAPVSSGEVAARADDANIVYITSPFVGTFYRSPSPDAPSFVEVGSSIRDGQSLCIVEAMKLMNEIESDCAGVIVDILAENGKPVEFGQKLFKVKKA
jgi:acetyl-CoA carboxylase biotin carboxyl carrier protein